MSTQKQLVGSLPIKLWLLACLPLCFQLIFVTVCWQKLARAEAESNTIEHAHIVDNLINSIVRDVCAVKILTTGKPTTAVQEMGDVLKQLARDVERANHYLGGDQSYQAALQAASQGVAEADSLLAEYKQEYLASAGQLSKSSKREMEAKEKKATDKMVKFISLNATQRPPMPEIQDQESLEREWQRQMLLSVFFSIGISLVASLLVTRHLNGRLVSVAENATRVSAQLPLNPCLNGDDEIAQLDKILHRMADSVSQARRAERAVIADAGDVICSLNKDGCFIAANPAALKLLGYQPADLIGLHFLDIVTTADADKLASTFALATDGTTVAPQTVQARKKDGQVVDVLWTVQWSREDEAVFCILYDLSAKIALQRAKEQIVAMVTHDLRSPLTTVQHVIELLESSSLANLGDRGKQLCEEARISTENMMSLINNLLDLEKIRADMLELQIGHNNLAEIFVDAMVEVASHAAKKEITLQLQPTEIVLSCDRERTTQIIVNLLITMIAKSDPPCEITLSASVAESEVHVRIVGVGDQMRGWKNFADAILTHPNVDNEILSTRDFGITVSRCLIQLHRGSLSLWHQEHAGNTITITFPRL